MSRSLAWQAVAVLSCSATCQTWKDHCLVMLCWRTNRWVMGSSSTKLDIVQAHTVDHGVGALGRWRCCYGLNW
jgi:hypothetical protein